MALIICPGCKRAVSKFNSSCPYCNVSLDKSICCPKCKSPKVSKLEKKQRFLKFEWKKRSERYVCAGCGNKFFEKDEGKE